MVDNAIYPLIKIYLHGTSDITTREELPYATESEVGFELIGEIERVALPNIGRAVFARRFGAFNFDGDTQEDATISGEVEDNLLDRVVSIDISQDDGETFDTAFLGYVSKQRASVLPGGVAGAGRVEYHCADLLGLYRDSYLFTHAYYHNGNQVNIAEGFPGFNFDGQPDKEETGVTVTPASYIGPVRPHSPEGLGEFWTVGDQLDYVLRMGRKDDDFPKISIGAYPGSGGNPLNQVVETQYAAGESVFSIISKLVDIKRGVYGWFNFDNGGINPRIDFAPMITGDYSQFNDAGTEITVPGAETLGTTVSVDLVGDHRLGPDADQRYEESLVDSSNYGGLTVYGERMEIAVTLAPIDDTLAPRYTTAEVTALEGTPNEEVAEVRYGHVLRSFGIPYDWTDASVGNSDGEPASKSSIDYRFSNDGWTSVVSGAQKLSPIGVDFTDSLPLLSGIDYSVDPPVAFDDTASPRFPERVPVNVFIKDGDNYTDLSNDSSIRVTINRDGTDIKIDSNLDSGNSRMLSALGAEGLIFVTGIRLPQRPYAFVSRVGGVTGISRIKNIYVKDAHLWTAHEGCILGLDSDGAPIYPARTVGDGLDALSLTIARDDRLRLRNIARQAAQYYLITRRKGSYSLRCGGIAGSDPDTGATWPKLGQIISTVSRAGIVRDWKTPVTRIAYSHDLGLTTWTTDFSDREFI